MGGVEKNNLPIFNHVLCSIPFYASYILVITIPFVYHYICLCPLMSQPDRGAKRLREEDGGAAAGEEDSRGGKQQKGLGIRELARHREATGIGIEGGVEMRDTEELAGDRKKILEKLMDQDEEEPEVGEFFTIIVTKLLHFCKVLCLFRNSHYAYTLAVCVFVFFNFISKLLIAVTHS